MPLWTFVRHGQSEANAGGWLAGTFDSPLTSQGREEARRAAEVVAEVSFVRVFTSDSSRARDTARLLLRGRRVPMLSTAHLRERHCGLYERRNIAELEPTGEMDSLTQWSYRPPGGESLRDVARRAMRWLVHEDAEEDTLVVAHGALIRSVIGLVDGRSLDDIGTWRPHNCETASRTLERGFWTRLYDATFSSG